VSGHGRFDQGVSVVFLPEVQYPNGYRVQLSGGSLLSRPGGKRLFIRANPNAQRVSVSVVPR
jgi:endoglycosylceramidase